MTSRTFEGASTSGNGIETRDFEPSEVRVNARADLRATSMRGTALVARPVCVAVNRLRGFTLIELIVTVVIFGILAGIALPAFQQLSASNTVRRGVDDLSNGFLSARTMAVNNGRPVTICALSGDACSNDPADWANGWAAYQECGAANSQIDNNTCGGNPEPVFARSAGNAASWTALDDDDNSAPTRFVFESNGMLSAPASEDWPVHFELASSYGDYKSTLYVNQLGRVCVEVRNEGNCE